MFSKWSRSWLVAASAFAATLAPAARASAQEPPASPEKKEAEKATPGPAMRSPRPGDVTKVFVLRYVGASALRGVLQVFPAMMAVPASSHPNAIGVSAAPGVMAAIEETIKRLDVPPPPQPPHKSIELTGYVLEALAQPLGSAGVPSELEAVVAQLKRTFSYAQYRLLDTLVVRGVDNSTLGTEAVGAEEQGVPGRMLYKLRVSRAEVLTGEEGPTVRLVNFGFEAQIPIPEGTKKADPSSQSWQSRSVGVHADIEIRAGQRVVVGNSGVGDPSKAIILVLSAKVVD